MEVEQLIASSPEKKEKKKNFTRRPPLFYPDRFHISTGLSEEVDVCIYVIEKDMKQVYVKACILHSSR